jgi:hypothetical protein
MARRPNNSWVGSLRFFPLTMFAFYVFKPTFSGLGLGVSIGFDTRDYSDAQASLLERALFYVLACSVLRASTQTQSFTARRKVTVPRPYVTRAVARAYGRQLAEKDQLWD